MCVPKRRENLGILLWFTSAWYYIRQVNTVTQDSILLFVFKIIITISFILIRKVFSESRQFLVFENIFKTSWGSLEEVYKMFLRRFLDAFIISSRCLERWTFVRLGKQEIATLKMFSRPVQDMSWRRFEGVLETKKCLLDSFKLQAGINVV